MSAAGQKRKLRTIFFWTGDRNLDETETEPEAENEEGENDEEPPVRSQKRIRAFVNSLCTDDRAHSFDNLKEEKEPLMPIQRALLPRFPNRVAISNTILGMAIFPKELCSLIAQYSLVLPVLYQGIESMHAADALSREIIWKAVTPSSSSDSQSFARQVNPRQRNQAEVHGLAYYVKRALLLKDLPLSADIYTCTRMADAYARFDFRVREKILKAKKGDVFKAVPANSAHLTNFDLKSRSQLCWSRNLQVLCFSDLFSTYIGCLNALSGKTALVAFQGVDHVLVTREIAEKGKLWLLASARDFIYHLEVDVDNLNGGVRLLSEPVQLAFIDFLVKLDGPFAVVDEMDEHRSCLKRLHPIRISGEGEAALDPAGASEPFLLPLFGPMRDRPLFLSQHPTRPGAFIYDFDGDIYSLQLSQKRKVDAQYIYRRADRANEQYIATDISAIE